MAGLKMVEIWKVLGDVEWMGGVSRLCNKSVLFCQSWMFYTAWKMRLSACRLCLYTVSCLISGASSPEPTGALRLYTPMGEDVPWPFSGPYARGGSGGVTKTPNNQKYQKGPNCLKKTDQNPMLCLFLVLGVKLFDASKISIMHCSCSSAFQNNCIYVCLLYMYCLNISISLN